MSLVPEKMRELPRKYGNLEGKMMNDDEAVGLGRYPIFIQSHVDITCCTKKQEKIGRAHV